MRFVKVLALVAISGVWSSCGRPASCDQTPCAAGLACDPATLLCYQPQDAGAGNDSGVTDAGGTSGVDGGRDAGVLQGPPHILTPSLPDAIRGRAYRQAIQVDGGAAPLSWSLRGVQADLRWLGIDSDAGVLIGTPDASTLTSAVLTVVVTASDQQQDNRQLFLTVRDCLDGEVGQCSAPSGNACYVGTEVCQAGTFGLCDAGTPSGSTSLCGATCSACATNADRCTSGVCKCGGLGACSGATPQCCPNINTGSSFCVNTQTDPDYCGGCMACDTDRTEVQRICDAGACQYPCLPGFARCAPTQNNRSCLTSLNTDPANCGTCGNACPTTVPNATVAPNPCDAGSCGFTCNPGFADCDSLPANGCEINTLNGDINNCGTCGKTCVAPTGGTVTCFGGQCMPACATGSNLCNSQTACFRNDDVNHCGGCNAVCPPSPVAHTDAGTCPGGACALICEAGWGNCDNQIATGCEANLNTSMNNCGSCGVVCTTGLNCYKGGCCSKCANGLQCCNGAVCVPNGTGWQCN